MKRPLLAVLLAVFGVAAAGHAPAAANDPLRFRSARGAAAGAPTYREGEVIVRFRENATDREIERVLRSGGGSRARASSFGRRFLVKLEAGVTVPDAVRRLSAEAQVVYAEPNLIARAFQAAVFVPNDRLYGYQWNLRLINAERTWGIQKGDASVIVAVLDTGIAYENFGPFRQAPDLVGTTFVPGRDFVNGDDHANDDEGHGTHVAGTIAQATNNGEGVAGVAFQTALMPVKVLDFEGSGGFFEIAEGVDFAVERGAKVINLSLGSDSCSGGSQAMTEAVNRAVAADVTVVVAAGNEGDTNPCVKFPARLSNVIAVGAVDGRKRRAPYSDFGPELDVVAPGGDFDRDETGLNDRADGFADGVLQQTLDFDFTSIGRFDQFGYFFFQGTSMAAPHVAGAAALLYRQGITDPVAIQKALESTAEDLGAAGRDNQFGHGLIRPSVGLTGLGFDQ